MPEYLTKFIFSMFPGFINTISFFSVTTHNFNDSWFNQNALQLYSISQMRHFVLFLILYMYVVYTCERVLSDLRWRFIGPLGIVHSQFSNTMLKSLTTLWSCDLKCFDNGGIFITLVPYYDYLCDNKTWTFLFKLISIFLFALKNVL